MESLRYRLQTRTRQSEAGFSLPELLVVMLIVGILLTLGIGAYLRSQRNAENTQNRDKVATTYKTVANCKTENDGFFGKFTDIVGDYCLNNGSTGSGRIVNNNIRLCKIGSDATVTSDADYACRQHQSTTLAAPAAGVCWDQDADTSAADAIRLYSSPQYSSGGSSRIFNVGVCTFSDVRAADPDKNSSQGFEDNSDSQFLRISATRNDKAYFWVEDKGGFRSCSAKTDSNGRATIALRCQG